MRRIEVEIVSTFMGPVVRLAKGKIQDARFLETQVFFSGPEGQVVVPYVMPDARQLSRDASEFLQSAARGVEAFEFIIVRQSSCQ